MKAKLYILPGSHPCAAVEAALKLKGIDYRRVDMLPFVQLLWGPIRYGGHTVPGLRLDGERMVGSRQIVARLDELVPEPALYPADAQERERVLDAERWGDESLQDATRRVFDVLIVRRPAALESYAQDANLRVPPALVRPALGLTARALAAYNHVSKSTARADIESLPPLLDRVDELIADGVIGAGAPNAADLQIGSSIRLLDTSGDIRPLLAGRPLSKLIDLFEPAAGDIPAGLLPAEWLPQAGTAQAAPA